MEDILAIFPSRGLDNSMLVPIFIGLLIHAFFIETLGWSSAGLVVTGYLASVFAIAPQAGMVIIVEIIFTYLIVYVISEYFSRLGWWHSFFGRDRFLAFFIASLLVRLIYEVWFFQSVAGIAMKYFGMSLESTSHLYGIGLVVVPLTAHAMWRTGLRKGMIQVGAPVVLTYLFLSYILIPYTNFSIANFELTFQDLALDFASSPKIYITLILGMMIAARLNLKLGWDFNGIMIPALLAIAWYMPLKILTTFFEATLIAIVAWIIASLPIFRRTSMEGMRRLLLIFTVGLGLKYLICLYFAETNPGFSVTDLLGFGYILPSLIALNIWERHSWSLVVWPTLLTSFMAFVAGNLVGLALVKVDEIFIRELAALTPDQVVDVRIPEQEYLGLSLAAVQNIPIVPEDFVPATPASRLQYQRALAAIRNMAFTDVEYMAPRWITRDFADDLTLLHLMLARTREPGNTGRELLILREPLESSSSNLQGWGSVIFAHGCKSELMVETPYPHEEPASLDAALILHSEMRACTLLVNGWRTYRPGEGAVLRRASSPFSVAHTILNDKTVAQVRVWKGKTTLFVHSRIPPNFNLAAIKRLFPGYGIEWRTSDKGAFKQKWGWEDFIEVFINEDDFHALYSDEALEISREDGSGLAYVRNLLTVNEDWISPTASEAYQPALFAESEYFSSSIIRPLRRYLRAGSPNLDMLMPKLKHLKKHAAAVGYDLKAFYSGVRGDIEVLLLEPEPVRRWGIYLFRSGGSNWNIEAPRPEAESATLQIGLDFYGRLNASAIYIAGADLNARSDGYSDITSLNNQVNPFQAAHRAAYPRHAGSILPWMLQIRGMSVSRDYEADALVSLAIELPKESPQPPLVSTLEDDLKKQGWSIQVYDGSIEQIGLKGVDNFQQRYSVSLASKSTAILWISSERRQSVRPFKAWGRHIAGISSTGIPIARKNIEEAFKPEDENGDESMASNPKLPMLLEWCESFSKSRNFSFLRSVMEGAKRNRIGFGLIEDLESGKHFISLYDDNAGLVCIVRASESGSDHYLMSQDNMDAFRELRYGNGLSMCNREVAP